MPRVTCRALTHFHTGVDRSADRPVDRITGQAATCAFAVPEFVISVGLLLVLSLWTGRLPAVTLTGADGDPATWTMLIMPVLALVIPQTGWNTCIVRGALADQAAIPHVEAAHFDGLPIRPPARPSPLSPSAPTSPRLPSSLAPHPRR
ncbi:hypothetical protein [Streptomyces sp. NPDC088246]|uniref:hypothetical protein n=1 Tax=Streptomyces sp. NPDC088246 TaxID=3365842 RepID=UPI003818B4FB